MNGKRLPPELLTAWYYFLWATHLDQHPELVAYTSQFDDFSDRFAKRTVNNQADAIRLYVKRGRASIMERDAVKMLIRALQGREVD